MHRTLPLLLLTLGLSTAVVQGQSTPSGQSTAQVRTDIADSWITTKIQAAYFMDADIKSRTIDVTTKDGVVTLTGTVRSSHERDQAVSIAKTIDGVKQVMDRLVVESGVTAGTTGRGSTEPAKSEKAPGSDEIARITQSDPVILTSIKTQFALDPQVSVFSIDVDVDHGVVTLGGSVKDETARARAVAIAKGVSGVREVRDRLIVKQ